MVMRRHRIRKSIAVILVFIFLTGVFVFNSDKLRSNDVNAAESIQSIKHNKLIWSFDADAYIGRNLTVKKDPYAEHAFNIDVSDNLPMDRKFKDFRNPTCKKEKLKLSANAYVSVIISFHNEARSALLRTVVSVLNRSPDHLLKEIILVDDFSKNESDGKLLTNLPKVKLVRNAKREGVARSRANGVSVAEGQYIVFIDSHCEVNVGWMEHLLQVVQKDFKTLASPIIDIIRLDDFKYKPSSEDIKGGFDWSLNFRWLPLSNDEKSKRSNPAQVFRSPILLGGLFMTEKSWFLKIGGFDEGLEIWGAENIELSFKAWMCGGQVVVVPCSRVGHVFRNRHPYSFNPKGGNAVYLSNSRRLADVWLENYKEFFYETKPLARKIKIESVDDQIQMKQKLKCKSFQWFLDEIYPEMKPHKADALAYGQLQQGNQCLQTIKDTANASIFQMQDCAYTTTSQEWTLLKSGFIRQNDTCLAPGLKNDYVYLRSCTNKLNQKWIRKQRLLIHSKSGLCLESSAISMNTILLVLSPCRLQAYSQKWDFTVELQLRNER